MNLLHVELEGEQNLSVLFPWFAGKSGDLPELKKDPETRPQFWVMFSQPLQRSAIQ